MNTSSVYRQQPKSRLFAWPRHKSDSIAECSANDDGERERLIAERAYFYAQRRGFAPGDELADWLQAESDVDGLSTVRNS